MTSKVASLQPSVQHLCFDARARDVLPRRGDTLIRDTSQGPSMQITLCDVVPAALSSDDFSFG